MNYKKSKQRDRLLEILQGTKIHPSADWLYNELKKEFPSLSMGTVYRNLSILIEQGLAKKIDFGSTFDRYDAITDDHYHFVCEKCGKIDDIDVTLSKQIDNITKSLKNYTVHSHRIEFFGYCQKCIQ